ncbi:MAG: hypothetical protein KY464_03285 [Gemmatimonadetes bacterium]|nr:hypothetical protein [Gemmatimonadota bacterium]
MSNRVSVTIASLALVAGLGTAGGCRTAANTAAAGAAGAAAIVLNDQNAEAEIAGSLADVDGRAKRVLRDMGLLMVDAAMEDNATEWEYEARSGERVVHIKLERRSPTVTKLSVSSRVGTTLNYDVSHARMVVERIRQLR